MSINICKENYGVAIGPAGEAITKMNYGLLIGPDGMAITKMNYGVVMDPNATTGFAHSFASVIV